MSSRYIENIKSPLDDIESKEIQKKKEEKEMKNQMGDMADILPDRNNIRSTADINDLGEKVVEEKW